MSRHDEFRVNGRLFFADAIRAYAIILVVMLHVSGTFVVQFDALDPSAWWIMNAIDSFSRPAVPLFVMISGMFLLDPARQQRIGTFFKKRIGRIALPFFGWAMIYLAWRTIYHAESMTTEEAVREIIQGPVYTHLWFIYMIIGLYLLTPVLRIYVRYSSRSNQMYFLTLWFIFASVLPVIDRYLDLGSGIYRPVFQCLGYYLLGHMLRDHQLTRQQMRWALLLVLGLTAFTAAGSFVLTMRNDGIFDGLLYGNSSPNVFLMSIAVFLLLKSMDYGTFNEKVPVFSRITGWIASASFTIYLSHPIILELYQGGMLGFRLNAMTIHPLIGLSVTTLATIAVCLLFALAMRPIPVVRRFINYG
jgi:surface polysaccharide O-acyltransferase-like enzyme